VPFKNLRQKLRSSADDLDRTRLHDRYHGEVQGLQVVPRYGSASLEVVIADGSGGRAVAVFTGRRRIAGLSPGKGVLFEGVGREEQGRMVLLNPAYTLLP
jgi:hypothetical protein